MMLGRLPLEVTWMQPVSVVPGFMPARLKLAVPLSLSVNTTVPAPSRARWSGPGVGAGSHLGCSSDARAAS
jgi:hypothetical protein